MYQQSLQQLFRAAHFPVEKYGPSHLKVTQEIIGELRVLPYFGQWKRALEEEWFHVKMEDHSLFLFNDGPGGPSYSFLHAPVVADSYRSFLIKQGLLYTARNRSQYMEEYGMVFETAQARQHVTPIRYDLDRINYREGVHPVAHIHIGLDNKVRLAVRREMSPVSFALFVMRHMYPECWTRLVERATQFRLKRLMRDGLQVIPEDYWNEIDSIELHLE